MKHVTIIATSLDKDSKSQVLAKLFEQKLQIEGISAERIDLRELDLPIAGPDESWNSPEATSLKESVKRASHIVFAVPIYCYDVNSAAKNVIELTGRAFSKKVIGFICSAGGNNSYMSVMSFANHLMLDFRSIIVPRFLYVNKRTNWQDEGRLNPEIEDRMKQLINDLKEVEVKTEIS